MTSDRWPLTWGSYHNFHKRTAILGLRSAP